MSLSLHKKAKSPSQKSIVIVDSSISKASFLEDGNEDSEGDLVEEEIAAHVVLTKETPWRWMVLLISFIHIMFVEGSVLTFSVLAPDLRKELNLSQVQVLCINSICFGSYFGSSPFSSAIINRYGFRTATKIGSYFCTISCILSFLSNNYYAVIVFYGIFFGVGLSLLAVSAILVIGFYFQTNRALAFTLANTGASVGLILFELLHSNIIEYGWRSNVLLKGGFFGLTFFTSIVYIPLSTATVQPKGTSQTQMVTMLPSVEKSIARGLTRRGASLASNVSVQQLKRTRSEKVFSTASSMRYPTAADLMNESKVDKDLEIEISHAGPSRKMSSAKDKLVIMPSVSKGKGLDSRKNTLEVGTAPRSSQWKMVIVEEEESEKRQKRNWWRKLLYQRRQEHIRPLYRDDAFYNGNIEKLPEYEETKRAQGDCEKSANLRYHLQVSRVASKKDLNDKHGLCTISLRRILASMLDGELLKTKSYVFFCLSFCSAFFVFLIPILFIKQRNAQQGMDTSIESWYACAMGFSGIFGRFIFGAAATKFDPLNLLLLVFLINGVVAIMSNFYFTFYFQMICCSIYAFAAVSISNLRSILLVKYYGLEKLTNATGLLLLFQGIGALFGPPIAGILSVYCGMLWCFLLCGIGYFIAVIMIFLAKLCAKREKKILSESDN